MNIPYLEESVKLCCLNDRMISISRVKQLIDQKTEEENDFQHPHIMTYAISSNDFREAKALLDGPLTEDQLEETVHEVCLESDMVIRCTNNFLFLRDDYANTVYVSDLKPGTRLAAVIRKTEPDLSYQEYYLQSSLTVAEVRPLIQKTGKKYYHVHTSGRSYYYCLYAGSGLSVIGRS